MKRAITVTLTIGVALALGACASDSLLGTSGGQSTAAIGKPDKPAVDPACAGLASRIETLRKDGVVERVEAAAKGKGGTVSVKRASLSQIAELEKANAEFQAKCSTLPRTAALVAPVQPAAPPAAVGAKAAAPVKAKAAAAKAEAAKAAAEAPAKQ
ncbi:MAG: hypothetical protein AB7O57_16180 [Hyphomicrobiaceae bacterium]